MKICSSRVPSTMTKGRRGPSRLTGVLYGGLHVCAEEGRPQIPTPRTYYVNAETGEAWEPAMQSCVHQAVRGFS